MSKSSRGTLQKKKTPRRYSSHVESPENLPEAISWLRKLLGTTYAMNAEGIIRLKSQFDQIYDDHVTEFNKKLRTVNYEDTVIVRECMHAKASLGHLLAVCKFLERIIDVTNLKNSTSIQKRSSNELTQSLKKDLTRELRFFSQHLQETQAWE